MAQQINVLGMTDLDASGQAVTHYAKVIKGKGVGGDPERYYISGICEGNREGFATWADAARYVNATWPNMPIKGSAEL
jgi:hypothetical protein